MTVQNGTKIALNKAQQALSQVGIAKDQRNQHQGWNFRGIDNWTNALSPIKAEFGLMICKTETLDHKMVQLTQNGKLKFHHIVKVKFVLGCIEDDSELEQIVFGEAMDNGDKGLNKAMTSALKNMLQPAFFVPIEGQKEDPDTEVHEGMEQTFKNHPEWKILKEKVINSGFLEQRKLDIDTIGSFAISSWDTFIKDFASFAHHQQPQQQEQFVPRPVSEPYPVQDPDPTGQVLPHPATAPIQTEVNMDEMR